MVKQDKDRESLMETMNRYDQIMRRVAVHRTRPVQRLELTIEGTIYTHLTEEEFMREFVEWLEKEQQTSRFIGTVRERSTLRSSEE